MRHIELTTEIRGVAPAKVLETVVRFERYPELAPHVQSVDVHETLPAETGSSSWELHFRSGLLRWTERERFLLDELRIEFAQETGDFDAFSGGWEFRADGDGCVLRFFCDFDFGIPSLAGILDPIADRVIRETVAWAIVGLFADVVPMAGFTLPEPTTAN